MHTFFNYLQKTLVEKVYLNAPTLLPYYSKPAK